MSEVIKDEQGNTVARINEQELSVKITKYGIIEMYHASTGLDVMLKIGEACKGLAIRVPENCKTVVFSVKLKEIEENE